VLASEWCFAQTFRLRDTASAADRAGVAELWLWEDCFLQGGIAAAAVALASSETLTVGFGVPPAPLRNVATTAMEIATLGRGSPAGCGSASATECRTGCGRPAPLWRHR
jgi:alkanesulfonate monooxygenase SsuD/methylene tetrahydromethanopterin reductase-like flavin-dependent oxidoreductase (luciferase family)